MLASAACQELKQAAAIPPGPCAGWTLEGTYDWATFTDQCVLTLKSGIAVQGKGGIYKPPYQGVPHSVNFGGDFKMTVRYPEQYDGDFALLQHVEFDVQHVELVGDEYCDLQKVGNTLYLDCEDFAVQLQMIFDENYNVDPGSDTSVIPE